MYRISCKTKGENCQLCRGFDIMVMFSLPAVLPVHSTIIIDLLYSDHWKDGICNDNPCSDSSVEILCC